MAKKRTVSTEKDVKARTKTQVSKTAKGKKLTASKKASEPRDIQTKNRKNKNTQKVAKRYKLSSKNNETIEKQDIKTRRSKLGMAGSFLKKQFQNELDEYMKEAGYQNYQKYSFKTQDGYTLRFFRIQKKGTPIQNGKKVVYMQHGLLDSSDTWIVNFADKAPAFMMAERGYDVWLGNTRGNVYSNPELSPQKKDYWNFTFDQMAKYDLPAAFKNINQITNKKIHYIGHSQGSLIMFIALSERNQVIEKYLASYSACGPVVYLKHIKVEIVKALIDTIPEPLLKGARKFTELIQSLVGHGNFGMPTQFSNLAQDFFISLKDKLFGANLGSSIQKLALKTFSDQFIDQLSVQRMSTIFQHYPSGTSLNNIAHFLQYATNGGKFCKFSRRQDSTELYDLRKVRVTVPVHLFVGGGDLLASVQDAQNIYKEIGAPNKKMTTFHRFGHASFMWGNNTKDFIDRVQKEVINA